MFKIEKGSRALHCTGNLNVDCNSNYLFDTKGEIQTYSGTKTDTKGKLTIDENEGLAHIDGIAVPFGLFQYIDGHHYYADSDGYLVKGKTIYISGDKRNGLGEFAPGLYYFDAEGHMPNPLEGEQA